MAISTLIISPPWFRGFDCVFEYFGVLVFLLIALFAYKATKMTNDQKTKWLFVSFLLIAASYFIKAFRNINLYFPFERQLLIGSLEVKYTSLAIINLAGEHSSVKEAKAGNTFILLTQKLSMSLPSASLIKVSRV